MPARWPSAVLLLKLSEHADGERRGPVSIRMYPKMRFTETFRVPPSRFDRTRGVYRRHAPKSLPKIDLRSGRGVSGLWPAPGKGRDQWVGFVRLGELVEVLEGPAASEAEGDFFLVRRHNGARGWLKRKNMHLPLAVAL